MKQRFFVYLLAFSYPFNGYSLPLPGGIGMSPINFFTLALFPFLALTCLSRRTVPNLTSVGVLNLLYFTVGVLGSLFAHDQFGALRGAGGYLLDFFLCFVLAVAFLRTRDEIEMVFWVIFAAGMLHAFMGYIEWVAYFRSGKIVLPPFIEYFRPQASLKNYGFDTGAYSIPGVMQMFGFGSPSSASMGAELIIPFAAAYYGFKAYPKRRLFFGASTAFLFGAIVLSVARNAYVGVFLLLGLIFWLYRSPKRTFFPLVMRPYFVVSFFLAVVAFFYFSKDSDFYGKARIQVDEKTEIKTPVFLIERMNPFVSKGFKSSQEFFSSHFKLAVLHGGDNFGLGLGMQNFDDYIYARYPIKWGSHSNFIQILGDAGYWGLLVQLFIVGTTIFYGLSTYYKQPLNQVDHLPLFLTAAYAGLVATGVVRTFYYMPISFVLMGLIAKLYLIEKRTQEVPA